MTTTATRTEPNRLFAFALGTVVRAGGGAIIDCYFPAPLRDVGGPFADQILKHFGSGVTHPEPEAVAAFVAAATGAPATVLSACAELAAGPTPLVAVALIADTPIASTPEAYLKLHLLSHRLALPNTLDLTDLFVHLPNVAWTSDGAIAVSELAEAQRRARTAGRHLEVYAVDKVPRVPS